MGGFYFAYNEIWHVFIEENGKVVHILADWVMKKKRSGNVIFIMRQSNYSDSSPPGTPGNITRKSCNLPCADILSFTGI